jgi:hypothetical protein
MEDTMVKAGDKVRGIKAGRFVVVEVMDFHGTPSARVREDAPKARGTIVLPLTAIVPVVGAE